ncbi:MAG: hypothetical protein GEV13_09780 [Rhodospirillales bacterium]|nr:hypothetical protein [Rhodospirillales bacterium]
MKVTSLPPPARFDLPDLALLGTLLVVAIIGSSQMSLMVIDGAGSITVAWLGNAWALFYDQVIGRAVSTLLTFGPAWALSGLVDLPADVFVVVAHVLNVAVPFVFWLAPRAVEPQRIFSRLYLAMSLVLVFFTSEMVPGMGFWMIWLAVLGHPQRSRQVKVIATVVIAPLLVFTHPAMAITSIVFAVGGFGLSLLGRPFPRHLAIASAAMGVLVTAGYFATSALWPATNPTLAGQLQGGQYNYVNPLWMLGTFGFFPVLAVFWLLLLAPGLDGTAARWRLSRTVLVILAVVGLWFAFNGTNVLTWIFARSTAPVVLAVALCLALASPAATWQEAARRPLMIFAAIMATAAVSYGIDLFLFGRASDARLAPLIGADGPAPHVAALGPPSPPPVQRPLQVFFKWLAAPDYVRDIINPYYGGERMTFAFYSFFRSDRRAVLYKLLDKKREWVPFSCTAVDGALKRPHDAIDIRMLRFIREHYCV